MISVGGTHLELQLTFQGDEFEGTVQAAWLPPPVGMLRTAPPEVQRRMAERGEAKRVWGGHRIR